MVVTTRELETRLRSVYEALHMPPGQLEALTGITERRWWDPGYPVSAGATAAARHALANSEVRGEDLDAVVYAGVCRELYEPATACRVAAALGVKAETTVHDVSNACLGVLSAMVDVANRIELGQIRAGLVVSCETAREINDVMIDKMVASPTMETFKYSLATLTGGSGAVAVLLTDGSFSAERRRRLVGGVAHAAPQFHELCRWGLEALTSLPLPHFAVSPFTSTDSAAVLKHGVELGIRTWAAFLKRLGWVREGIDKVICHQVGSGHRDSILRSLGVPAHKEFHTFPYLGNVGTVSLPLTAALAEDRDFLRAGDRVAFLGIGSGLNCLMLGVEW